MIITFANQKGGCGKSTTLVLFANYLSSIGIRPILIDADHQRSILKMRHSDLSNFTQPTPYEIIELDLSNIGQVVGYIDELKKSNDFFLIDAPGNLTEDGLLHLLYGSDYIVVPFQYERKCLDSMGVFISTLAQISDKLSHQFNLLFLPNRINIKEGLQSERQEWVKVDDILKQNGMLLPLVKDLVCLKRINTIIASKEQLDASISCLQELHHIVCQTS